MALLWSGHLVRLVVVAAVPLAGPVLCQDICPDTTGLRQSPINLDLCADTRQSSQQPLRFRNFDQTPAVMSLTNTGTAVAANISWAVGRHQPPQVSGAHLPGVFVPGGLRLHWGANRTSGSEHSVNGRFYPAELYIICRNILYTSDEEAQKHVDGLAGIIVFFEEQDVRVFRRRGLGLLAPELADIQNASTSVQLSAPPSLRKMMPRSLGRSVTYRGSATALPGCPEAVTWVALLIPVPVLSIELLQLRQLRGADDQPLVSSNSRPLQPLNGRPLYHKGPRPLCV